jgi:hypothetical protein
VAVSGFSLTTWNPASSRSTVIPAWLAGVVATRVPFVGTYRRAMRRPGSPASGGVAGEQAQQQ